MSNLQQVNPVGRLDVLVFRIVDRIAQTQAPAEWKLLQPFVEQKCSEWLGPQGRLFR